MPVLRGRPMRALLLTALLIPVAVSPAGARMERVPRSAKQCISRSAIRDYTAESHTRLIFHVDGGRAYRSYLPTPCDDILHVNNVSKLTFQTASSDKLCAGDTVTLRDRPVIGDILGGDTSGERCRLGRFEPITEMSLTEALRR